MWLLEPYEGLELESEDVARIFYSNYARRTGFRSSISKNRQSRKNREVIARKFVCCKEGFRAKQHENKKGRIYRPRAITRLGCEAMIMVKKQSNGKWIVAKFVKENNHTLLDSKKVVPIRSHDNVDRSRRVLQTIDSEKIDVSKEVAVPPNSYGFLMNDFNSHFDILGKRKRSPDQSIQNFLDYLGRMPLENPAFFYSVQLDEENSVCCIFWADARSRLAYNFFGDVVYFSSTIDGEVPFASFTGLNHHQQSTLFGCALLFELVESSFLWIFKTWLEAMSGRHPVTMMTNEDEAVELAVAKVFPKTHHCFPTWQILNEIQEQFSDCQSCVIDEVQKCAFLTDAIEEFELEWKSILCKYNIKCYIMLARDGYLYTCGKFFCTNACLKREERN